MNLRNNLFAGATVAAVLGAGAAQAVTVSDKTMELREPGIVAKSNNLQNIGTSNVVNGVFDIAVNFTSAPTASQQAAFDSAEAFWEANVFGYRTPFLGNNVPQLTIDASFPEIDGSGGILGRAGATSVTTDGSAGSGFMVSNTGIMEFDNSDADDLEASGVLDDVILHEMAHVMGFSDFFWDFVGATDGSGTDRTYAGALGLATYQNEFEAGATFVPVEEGFGSGTAFAHWDEVLFNNHGAERSNPELMTGFLTVPNFISETTLAAFSDIGYATEVTNPITPVPLPGSGFLLIAALTGCLMARRGGKRRSDINRLEGLNKPGRE